MINDKRKLAEMADEYQVAVVEERIMSNVEPQRPVPQSTVQLAHMTSDAVVQGLGKSPYLLGLVVLTAFGLGTATYFLSILINGQQMHLKSLLEVQQQQMDKVLQAHQREFDALLEMSNRLSTVQQSPIAPSSQILNQPTAPPSRR